MIAPLVLIGLLGGTTPAMAMPDQAVIVRFQHSGNWSDFFEWEPSIEKAVSDAGYEYDGNELAVDGSDGTIYMYGPDANKLFLVALPALNKATFLTHKVATLRYGKVDDPNAVQKTVPVDP